MFSDHEFGPTHFDWLATAGEGRGPPPGPARDGRAGGGDGPGEAEARPAAGPADGAGFGPRSSRDGILTKPPSHLLIDIFSGVWEGLGGGGGELLKSRVS